MTANTRRAWLKKAFVFTAGIPAGTALLQQLMAAPVSESEFSTWRVTRAADAKVRLDANENPYGPSEKARKAIVDILKEANRYPFGVLTKFKEVLAVHEGVTPDHIAIGAGSADLLCATASAFGLEGGSFVSAYPTFPLLMNYGEVVKARWDKVNLNNALETDYNALASAVKDDTRLVFVCNPNNPTGTLVDIGLVRSFCEEVSKKTTVFADEAYLEFLEPAQQVSMVDLVKGGGNVIVSRTFSKIYGLAGLRIGYSVARPALIRKIEHHQMGFPVSQVALAAATASLGDTSFMELTRRKNAEARTILTNYLDKKRYFYGKSFTNFVFFDPQGDARQIMEKLGQRGIGIRVWDYLGKQWCRVSVGTTDEMKLLVKNLDEII